MRRVAADAEDRVGGVRGNGGERRIQQQANDAWMGVLVGGQLASLASPWISASRPARLTKRPSA